MSRWKQSTNYETSFVVLICTGIRTRKSVIAEIEGTDRMMLFGSSSTCLLQKYSLRPTRPYLVPECQLNYQLNAMSVENITGENRLIYILF